MSEMSVLSESHTHAVESRLSIQNYTLHAYNPSIGFNLIADCYFVDIHSRLLYASKHVYMAQPHAIFLSIFRTKPNTICKSNTENTRNDAERWFNQCHDRSLQWPYTIYSPTIHFSNKANSKVFPKRDT